MNKFYDGPLPLQDKPEREHLYDWVCREEEYVGAKFDDQRDGHDASMASYDLEDFWLRQITQYLDRARAFLEAAGSLRSGEAKDVEADVRHLEQRAQQALAKGFMTFKGCVESSIRVFGPLPRPGVTSGVVEPWEDAPYVDGVGM